MECCNAGVLLQDIENYLNGEALLSRSLSGKYRIRKRIGKYRKRIVAAIGFVGLLMIISVISFVSIQLERKKSRELEQRLASLSEPQQQTNEGASESGKIQPGGLLPVNIEYKRTALQDGSADSPGSIFPVVRNPTGRIIYVDANAAGENNGYSWADAFVCLQDALT